MNSDDRMEDIAADKENMSPLRLHRNASAPASTSSSPPKPTKKKARSRSIGPEELEATRRKSPNRGRRRSAVTQVIQLPPKGILPAKDEEQKRKEARRKSLANRRVSFAPEATLHTWDVIEYMRDATASSSSSSAGRLSFAATPMEQTWGQESDPPSTPPEQADDDDDDLPTSPEHQRSAHQKKRRRSSAIPPMNFNNPEDEFSSSPVSGESSSVVEGSSDVDQDEEEGDYESEDEEGESTAMSLDNADETVQSEETESTDSSLTARLRQASEMAGTRGIDFDENVEEYDDEEEDQDEMENGDMSMEMVTQEVTHSFKPWAQQSYGPPPMAKNIIALQDQENMNPFSPAFRQAYSHRKPQGVPSTVGEDTEPGSEDMTMDMTQAVGGILPSNQQMHDEELDEENADMTMDMTCAVGGILQTQRQSQTSSVDEEEDIDNDMSMDMTRAVGGILQSQQRHQSHQIDEQEDEENDMSMDMTRAVGGILPSHQTDDDTQAFGDETMDFTQAIGKIVQPQPSRVQPPRSAVKRRLSTAENGSPHVSTASPAQPSQRRTVAQVSAKRRRSSAQRSSLGDATMDMTVAVGGIQHQPSPAKEDRRASLRKRRSSGMSSAMDEQTMDFTTVLGGIRQPVLKPVLEPAEDEEDESADKNENLSMIFNPVKSDTPEGVDNEVQQPATARSSLSPARTEVPATPNHEGHFRQVEDQSAKKLLTPIFENLVSNSAIKDSAGSRRTSSRLRKSIETPNKSPASIRKSPASFQKAQKSPEKSAASPRKSPASARKSSATPRKSPASARKQRQSLAPPLAPKSVTHGESIPSPVEETTQSFSPIRDQAMLDVPGEEIVYPTLPSPEPLAAPTLATPHTAAVTPHNLHTVSEAGSPMRISADTPEEIDMEMTHPASPSMEKQLRSTPAKGSLSPHTSFALEPQVQTASARKSVTPQRLQISPIKKAVTPQPMQSSPPRLVVTPQQPRLSPNAAVLTPQPLSISKPVDMTPQQAKVFDEPSRTISNSIKLMSTPRKDTGTTPLKRLRGMTPMKSPVKKSMTPHKTLTPKAKTPQAVHKLSAVELAGQQLAQELFAATKTGQLIPKVKLNDFLDMAGIKFMELALPTKRRYTVAPTPAKGARTDNAASDENSEDVELESAVVAAACTMPMLDLYQHSCRELKRYISEGKSFVKTLESEVYADPPPLISAYVSSSSQRKAEIDAIMRDIKTHARLGSKEFWYDWRSKLLDGLEAGLKGIKSGLEDDAKLLGEREQLLDTLLPDLLAKHESLRDEAVRLEEAAAATSEEEKKELKATRENLVEVDAQIEERKRMLAELQQELQEQESVIEAYGEGRAECLAQIQEAERVKDSCRGWSIDEVAALKASVTKLEDETGWTITSSSFTTLTMTYRQNLTLFFDTAAFPAPGSSAVPSKIENQPISLVYIGGKKGLTSEPPLPTETRFFLQLMRAQLQCLEQRTTPIKSLLRFVSSGWDISTNITEAVRRLRLEYPVTVAILSDERLAVDVDVLLPKVQTKVRLGFEISAAIVNEEGENVAGSGSNSFQVGTHIAVKSKVVYGETYNEKNMEGFLGRRCGGFGEGWEQAVRDLRVKLVATGRKG